jgi:hypothetical protein
MPGPVRRLRTLAERDLRRRVISDERLHDAAQALQDGAVVAEGWMARLRRHSRITGLVSVSVIVVLVAFAVLTSGGGTVNVSSAADARRTAMELQSGLKHVECRRGSGAWECVGVRKKHAWSCRIYFKHTDRQAITGTCNRGTQAP